MNRSSMLRPLPLLMISLSMAHPALAQLEPPASRALEAAGLATHSEVRSDGPAPSSLLAQAMESPTPTPTEPAPELTPEELKALTEALGADQTPSTTGISSPAQAETPLQAAASALQSMNPDMAVVLDVALAAFNTDEPLQAGGHDPSKTGFNLQQLEMSLRSSVDPYFSFNANLVFSEFGVEIEEAYVSTLNLPGNLKARGGQLLSNFGRVNNSHPHSWHFVDQDLVIGKFFGGEGNRGLGAELSWLIPLPWFAEATVSALNATGESTHRSYYGADNLGISSPLDLALTGALKQFFPFNNDLSLLWGLSAQTGPNPTGLNNRSLIVGTDFYLRYKPVQSAHRTSLSLEVELLHRSRQVPYGVLEDFGGYGQLIWQINPEWETGARAEYVSGLEDDYLDPAWTEGRWRYSGQLTYYPSHFSRLRLQGSMDRPGWLEKPIYAGMLALEVVVGAHGAHKY